MEKLKTFYFDYKQIVLDEIALEGLEGIGFDLLWRRVEKRIFSPVTDKMKDRFWHYIVHSKDIELYKLPEPVKHIEVLDRFTIIDTGSGYLRDPDDYLDGPYEYHPIENEFGSCKYYTTRILVPYNDVHLLSYSKLLNEFGDTLVLVASIEERWRALANHAPIVYLNNLSPINYCILELVGKSRQNGQMTVGKTNITKVVKEPKSLFYNRKQLQDLDLLRVQFVTQMLNGRGVKSLLLRLKRFYQPKILSMPKVGRLHTIVNYLSQKPDYCEKTDVMISQGMLTQPQSRRLRKTVNIFNFKEKLIIEGKKTKAVKRRFICLSTKSDDSLSSDEENNEIPLKCQYKVGVNLLRQAYEQFMNAGLKGLTQVELAQLLGIEFYTSRTICRIFRLKHLVREFLEDKGRQRTARFIAVASTGKIDKTYAEEKKKFLEYLNANSNVNENVDKIGMEVAVGTTMETSEPEIKVENDIDNKNVFEPDNLQNYVTEVKVLTGFENIKVKSLQYTDKNLSLRQLKFANGLLKVVKERHCVCGYQSLSTLVASETGEPKMDAKCLKLFLQKLINTGHLKMYKVKWPGFQQRYSNFICSPHIRSTDPVIKAKYKEISIRAASNTKVKVKRETNSVVSLSQLSLPRYMRIQKLHEVLMMFAYFQPIKSESHYLPQGFLSVVDIIPEFTVQFVIGNINKVDSIGINEYNFDDYLLSLKLKDAPPELHKILLGCKGFHITIRFNLKVLAMLGLIQLIYQSAVQTADHNNCGPTTFLLYVNRRSNIVDTTGIWPRPNVDIKSLEKSFYFEHFDDVKNYWNTVYNISINTKIHLAKRDRKKMTPPLRKADGVESLDNGESFCDGMGPCGFDSSFFMELPHSWNPTYMRIIKPPKTHKKIIKLPKLEHKKQKAKIKKKVTIKPIEIKPTVVLKKFRKRQCDFNSIKWTKEEDHIIILCKAAISIMSPVSQPGCLTIRNIVAKDLLSHNDPTKTKSACHRRALFLESNSTLQHEKQCILNEIRRNRNLVHKYEGLLKKIKIRYPGNMSKYINESRLPMIELVWILSQIAYKKFLNPRISCVATNIEDFYDNYTINISTSNKQCNIYKDPEYAVIKETIILTTILSFNNDLVPKIGNLIYSIFKKHPETALRIALDQLRKCGAVSAKEKCLNNFMHKFRVEDMVKTTYKISMNYQRKWISRLNSEFVDCLANIMDSEFPEDNCKGSSEVNCLLLEIQAKNAIDIFSSTIPAIIDSSGTTVIQEEQLNVIDIETKFKLKSGTLGWKNKCNLKKFSDLYKDALCYEEYFSEITSKAKVDTKTKNTAATNDIILKHLKQKGDEGSTFAELEKISNCNVKELVDKLTKMERENIIKRVGFFENVIVLIEFVGKWCTRIEEIHLIPSPWLTLKGEIRYDIFFKWTGVVMNKIFENPGCSISFLSDACEYLTTRSVQEVCVFLMKSECVKLHILKAKEVDLFSDDDNIVDITDYHEYDSVHNIIAFPLNNSITKYCFLRKLVLLNCDDEKFMATE